LGIACGSGAVLRTVHADQSAVKVTGGKQLRNALLHGFLLKNAY